MINKDQNTFCADIRRGNRRALARAITLIESTRLDHRDTAEALLEQLIPYAGKSIRLGISGVPGVGKSTFIECFGQHIIKQGHKLAVLAVDPSSKRSGGSILGDKTRMEDLSRNPNAFIRPSPAGQTLGGVARRTRETMILCEAAGYDVILIETVGVGQSETAVADMTDMFLLMLLPGGGDELQGIKKGIVELADLILVNKADGDMGQIAKLSAAQYFSALQLLRPRSKYWNAQVLTCSALKNVGIDDIWDKVTEFFQTLTPTDALEARRSAQALSWMWDEIGGNLLQYLRQSPKIISQLPNIEKDVAGNNLPATTAARRLINLFITPEIK
jgi:LAO/AO transport system kinase